METIIKDISKEYHSINEDDQLTVAGPHEHVVELLASFALDQDVVPGQKLEVELVIQEQVVVEFHLGVGLEAQLSDWVEWGQVGLVGQVVD